MPPTGFIKNAGVSRIANADDVLLVRQTRSSFANNMHGLTDSLGNVGLSGNASKCQFLCFNFSNPAPPYVGAKFYSILFQRSNGFASLLPFLFWLHSRISMIGL